MQSAKVDGTITVAHQIQPEDVAGLRDAGFTAIVNNRPDAEAPDQPSGAEIEDAARAAGLAYTALPVGRDGISPDLVAGFQRAMQETDGPVFAFCRTGTRSINLWALSQATTRDADALVRLAADAGYDLSGLRPVLSRMNEAG
ncbi:TIGR01244 family sulfur transferase [Stappia sp. ES.058]|uniref:TIGR01244 family sulfur transferase n=1 Tax=Stappia sp. ES.058 TaxID=1881061 RepID=UPI00087CFD75|nr:TIGR01244 family sulfur transferase [Stappia sp. ES.058]SDU44023.1 TIGR01244 family protein [Stappia sp. ES.058]